MSGFGERFKQKRLEQGLSEKAAAKRAGIKISILRDLEEENILNFKNRDSASDLAASYGVSLGLNEDVLRRDIENLWSDSSTAKAYLQQSYDRKSMLSINKNNKKWLWVGMGSLAATVLLIGGFYYGGIIGDQDVSELPISAPEEEVASEKAPEIDQETAVEEPGTAQDNGTKQDVDHEGVDAEESDGIAQESVAADDAQPEPVSGSENEAEPVDESVADQVVVADEEDEEINDNASETEVRLPRTGGSCHLFYLGLFLIWTGALPLVLSVILAATNLKPASWPGIYLLRCRPVPGKSRFPGWRL